VTPITVEKTLYHCQLDIPGPRIGFAQITVRLPNESEITRAPTVDLRTSPTPGCAVRTRTRQRVVNIENIIYHRRAATQLT